MTEVRYMISDAARILDIPTNVLRYLEYCLSLNIKRTNLGYRYYIQEDIDLLNNVRILRNKGFHMKVIKSILPYIDKVKDLDASKLFDLRERLEAALGLSGLEAQESLRAQYGKVIDINMEDGNLVYKDPATKQVTRLSTVTIKTEEVKTQPIAQEVDNSKSCDEVAAAATDVIIKESHLNEETMNPSESDTILESKGSFDTLKEPTTEAQEECKAEKKVEKKVTQIYDVNQARSSHYMGAKKNERLASLVKDFEKVGEKKVAKAPDVEGDISNNAASENEKRKVEFQNSSNQILERRSESSLLKDSQDKIVQFREIMCSIVMEALRQNNHTLTNDINDTVTQSIVKEMDYMMRVREERQEERFRQLDRTIRETQIQRQQAAATKEGKKKKPSKFFQKNKVRI